MASIAASDNDDVNAEQVQPEALAKAKAVLSDPEAKIADLGDVRVLLLQWISEVEDREALVALPDADGDSDSGQTESDSKECLSLEDPIHLPASYRLSVRINNKFATHGMTTVGVVRDKFSTRLSDGRLALLSNADFKAIAPRDLGRVSYQALCRFLAEKGYTDSDGVWLI